MIGCKHNTERHILIRKAKFKLQTGDTMIFRCPKGCQDVKIPLSEANDIEMEDRTDD